MDIKRIRKTNLQLLIKESGGRKLFGEKTGKSEAQISQLLSGSKTSRNIGDRLARELERTCEKAPGWMDQPRIWDWQKALGIDPLDKEYQWADGGTLDHPPQNLDFSKIAPKIQSQQRSSQGKDEIEFLGTMDAWDSNTPLGPDEVELPLFREVEMAAGGGRTEVIENHGAKLRFAKSTLARAGVDPANAACATVKGNSMERLIPDGTTVGVDTGIKEIRDGEIYAFDHEGMLRVKYLYRRPGGGLKIASENDNEHPDEEYGPEEVANNIRVIGRVFWWSVLR